MNNLFFKRIIVNKIFTLLIMASVYFIPLRSVHSATQGTIGTTSTGTIDITIALADVVQISALNDLIFPVWEGSGDMTEVDDLCIYSNTTGGGYNITATGSGVANAFTVTDGSNILAYNAYWNDVSGTNNGMSSLTTNVALTGQTGADTTNLDCTAGSDLTSRIVVEFLDANLSAAPVSIYTGVITFNIAPE